MPLQQSEAVVHDWLAEAQVEAFCAQPENGTVSRKQAMASFIFGLVH
jgi:hypothetical protein